MNVNNIRFGVIGCGSIAKMAFIPALNKSNLSELVAVASRDKSKTESFSTQFECDAEKDYESLLRRIDINAVYIATVPSTHEEIIITAAKYGKHILCEKPLTVSYNSARKIVDYCSKKKVGIFEGFMYQFHSQHQKVRDIVSDGEIGKPILFQAQFGFPPLNKNNYRYSPHLGGGALLDVGSYTVHAARNFFKCEPIDIYSSIYNNESEVDIHGTVTLNFGKGRTAQLSFGFNNFYQNHYTIWGTEGVISLERAFSLPHDYRSKLILKKQNDVKELSMDPCNHFIKEIEYFCKGITEEKEIHTWREEALLQATVINTIIEQNLIRNHGNE